MLVIRSSKLYYTASGIITLVGGRPVHRLRYTVSKTSKFAICFSFWNTNEWSLYPAGAGHRIRASETSPTPLLQQKKAFLPVCSICVKTFCVWGRRNLRSYPSQGIFPSGAPPTVQVQCAVCKCKDAIG